ncbi:MAG: hypothetical protein IPG17_21310 [Sandaracinaceae bacterium]|jgi:hypothetical protein|nr:hypothetical protein [Sandaracinaceae bacterium]MBP7683082.1 hypothetical protein [Deltaproteobacteria bacterium]
MTPRQLLHAAHQLVEQPTIGTDGFWARTSAALARQALEQAVQVKLSRYAGSLEDVPWTAQMLAVHGVCSDHATAARAYFVWSALSQALHHNGYELPPSAEALRGWIVVVDEVITALE